MDYLKYVNTRHGSDSSMRFSGGNTLPLVQRPFGFACFAPQTDYAEGGWFYHPDSHSLEGIRLTHQPSPWMGDYGVLVMQPQVGVPYGNFDRCWSGIDPDAAILEPHYLRYEMKRTFSVIELTPTEHGAAVKLEFSRDLDSFLSVISGKSQKSQFAFQYDPERNQLLCRKLFYTAPDGDEEEMALYCIFQFDSDTIDLAKSFSENPSGSFSDRELTTEQVCQAIHLSLKKKKIQFSVSESFISFDQARVNLKIDSDYSDFESLKEENAKIWNHYLSRIEIQADENTMKTFYSCMYRVFLYPHKAYEVDEKGNILHYAPCDRTVKKGYRYTDNGFWDTYRTVYSFYSIVACGECEEILNGFIQDFRDSGWLPRWTAGKAADCMPGTGIDAVIADAAAKGIIRGELLKTAFSGMEKHANHASPKAMYGREGCEDYLRLGYMPCDKYKESVNLTLDASYFDYCLSVVAEILGYENKKKIYRDRSVNYRNVFDKQTGFMRGRDSQGGRKADFSPFTWGIDYTEASAWQTTFAVQHDLNGLAELMGGREALIQKLDELFATGPEYDVGNYHSEIHEMTEMAAHDWGQCAISNQPSFHIPYIYAYFGETEKTRYWVTKICREGFSCRNNGFPGDEDNGSMAAWYIFAVLGIYPICPGKPEYTRIEPLVKNIKVLGKQFDLSGFSNIISHADLMSQIGTESIQSGYDPV